MVLGWLAAPVAFMAGSSLLTAQMRVRSPLVMAEAEPDFDLVIVGCGVGGHGAALHAVSKGLKVAVVAGDDVGGTCVNRGCVPSKALLAASGRVREMGDDKHLADLGITVGGVSYEREKVAAHANNLASRVAKNLGGSLVALGIETFMEKGQMVSPTEVKLVGNAEGKTITGKNVILATGSVPFVPPGIETDGKTVFTSDEALKLEWVPDWIAIIVRAAIAPCAAHAASPHQPLRRVHSSSARRTRRVCGL
jgi:dihydrolipoamide dehydrogenase